MAPKPRNISRKPNKKPTYGSFTHAQFPKVIVTPEKPMSSEVRDSFRKYFKGNSGYNVSVADRTKHPVIILREKFQKYGALDKITKILNSNKPLEIKIKDLYMEFSINLFVREIFDINRLSLENQFHSTQLLLQLLDPTLTLVRKFNPKFKPERNSVGITERNGSNTSPKASETTKPEPKNTKTPTTEDPIVTVDGDRVIHTYKPVNIGNKREVIDTRIPKEVRPTYDSKEYQGPVTKGKELVRMSDIERQNKEFNDVWKGVLEILQKTKKQTKKTRTQIITEFLKDKVQKARTAAEKLRGKVQEIDLDALKEFLIKNLRNLAKTQPYVIDEREIIRDVSNLFPTDYSLKTNERIDINEGNKRRATYPEIEKPGELEHLPVRLKDSINGEDIRPRVKKYSNPETSIKPTRELKSENTSLERFAKKPSELSREGIELMIEYNAHLDYLIEIKKIGAKDKKRLSDFFRRLLEKDEPKARDILSKILKNRPKTNGEVNPIGKDLDYRTPFEQQKENYIKRFEMINNLNISNIRSIFELIQVIRPESIIALAKEINFATRHLRTKLTQEEVLELEELSAGFEKFGKTLLKAKDNPDKFNDSQTQELLFWLKREKSISDSNNLNSFITDVLSNKRTTHPENIDLESWNILNRFADARNLFGQERINYLNKVLGLSGKRLYDSLEQMKQLLNPKKTKKAIIKEEPMYTIGEPGLFFELSNALKENNIDKFMELSGIKNKKEISKFESVLKSATDLSSNIRRLEYSKDIVDLIKKFNIKEFEKSYNNLKEFLNNDLNKSSNFYLDFFDLAERSRLILESMKTIAENQSRFIGKDFRKLLEILLDPKKVLDLDFFVWETLRKNPNNMLNENKTNKQENNVELNSEERSKINSELNKFLRSILSKKFSRNILEFIQNQKRKILTETNIIEINGKKGILEKTTNGIIINFGKGEIIEFFDNVGYALTNEGIIHVTKGLLWDSIKKQPIPEFLKSKENKIYGSFKYKEGQLIAYL